MSKTYTLTEMRKVVCWAANAGAALKLLASHGIVPQAEFQFGKRTLRLYDEDAMTWAVALRRRHDEDVKARRSAHASDMRAKYANQLAEGTARKAGRPGREASAAAERETLMTLLKAANTLLVDLKALHAKVDALTTQHSSVSFTFDDDDGKRSQK